MKNIKKYIKKIIEILSLKELRILPAYLAYSFVLASIPLFTIYYHTGFRNTRQKQKAKYCAIQRKITDDH